jgi:TldD protein
MSSPTPGDHRLSLARGVLLAPNDLNDSQLSVALAGLHSKDIDFADLYFERTTHEVWRIEDRKVASGQYSVTQGVGVRTVAQGRSALAYSGNLNPAALAATAKSAHEMHASGYDAARSGGRGHQAYAAEHDLFISTDIIPERSVEQKIALLQELDGRTRSTDTRIKKVSASLRLIDSTILVAASGGTMAADIRPLIQLTLSVVAEQNGRLARGAAGVGGRHGFDDLTGHALARLIQRATTTALVNLDARPAPAGIMPVVLGPGFPGVLLHEAVGHGLEGDAHWSRSSVFTEFMGTSIAAAGVTVVDDGSLPRLAGSLNIDDEGVPTERTVLIEKGRLTGLMQDRVNAALMRARSTGNARRESYARLPMPRMTNTFMEAGDCDPQEIIASVGNGIYAVEFGGGTVDISNGRFSFSATQAYLIENGRLTAPITGATLIGVGHEALKNISMIGNDLALDDGEAVCGKQGQSVQVGVGQPTIRIDNMVVGGSA